MRKQHWVSLGMVTSALTMYHIASQAGIIPGSAQAKINALPAAAKQYAASSGHPELGSLIDTGTSLVSAYQNGLLHNSGFTPSLNNGYGPGATSSGFSSALNGTGDIVNYFSPGGGCTEAVCAEIGQAREQILVQAYSFTSTPIAQALVAAHTRGVGVFIILDKSQRSEQYSSADFVAHAGIPTYIDDKHAIAHNKIMLIDHRTLITGSFNFTSAAEKSNAENLLIIRNRPDLYTSYENNFKQHYGHSQPYQGRGTSALPSSHGNQQLNFPPSNNLPTNNQPPSAYNQQPPPYQQQAPYQQPQNYQQPSGYPPANYPPAMYPPNSYPPANYQSADYGGMNGSGMNNFPNSGPTTAWNGQYAPQNPYPPNNSGYQR